MIVIAGELSLIAAVVLLLAMAKASRTGRPRLLDNDFLVSAILIPIAMLGLVVGTGLEIRGLAGGHWRDISTAGWVIATAVPLIALGAAISLARR